MASPQSANPHISDYSELAGAVPLEERLRIPDNTPASHLEEILQKLYDKGLCKEKAPAQEISYSADGFTVATVLSGDLSEVIDANGAIPTLEGQLWPKKTVFHFEFCDVAYNTPVHMKQRRVPPTRGGFATLAAEEIEKMLGELSQFPYTLDQIKVVGIDVRSRGTVQPRLCVASEVMDAQAQA